MEVEEVKSPTGAGNSSGRNGGQANEINRNKNNNNNNGEGNTEHHNQGIRGSSSQGLNMTYEGGGERPARRQQRAGRFCRPQAFEDLSKKVKQFSTAANKNIENKIKPTNEELRMSVDREWEIAILAGSGYLARWTLYFRYQITFILYVKYAPPKGKIMLQFTFLPPRTMFHTKPTGWP